MINPNNVFVRMNLSNIISLVIKIHAADDIHLERLVGIIKNPCRHRFTLSAQETEYISYIFALVNISWRVSCVVALRDKSYA